MFIYFICLLNIFCFKGGFVPPPPILLHIQGKKLSCLFSSTQSNVQFPKHQALSMKLSPEHCDWPQVVLPYSGGGRPCTPPKATEGPCHG